MSETVRMLVIKTGALGDVLRTTAILPGLAARSPGLELHWLTAAAARPLVEHHPLVHRVVDVSPNDAEAVAALGVELGTIHWDWVLSLDDEWPLCRLASALQCERLSGAHVGQDGERTYSEDVAPWFDMGLLSRFGKEEADRLKVANQKTHPQIYAEMLGIEGGRPALPLPEAVVAAAAVRAEDQGWHRSAPLIGLNTGAGGRWTSKGLPVDRVRELCVLLDQRLGNPSYLVLGGPDERERNRELIGFLRADRPAERVFDAGCDNPMLDFAAVVGRCDLLLTSDSLALHLGLATDRPIVAFFAPTSAAEIELYGLGEKVWSTAPDYCSYRPDADNSTLTPDRLADAVLRVLTAQA